MSEFIVKYREMAAYIVAPLPSQRKCIVIYLFWHTWRWAVCARMPRTILRTHIFHMVQLCVWIDVIAASFHTRLNNMVIFAQQRAFVSNQFQFTYKYARFEYEMCVCVRASETDDSSEPSLRFIIFFFYLPDGDRQRQSIDKSSSRLKAERTMWGGLGAE